MSMLRCGAGRTLPASRRRSTATAEASTRSPPSAASVLLRILRLLRRVSGQQAVAILPDHFGVGIHPVALIGADRVPIAGGGEFGQAVEAPLVIVVGVRADIGFPGHEAARRGRVEFGVLAAAGAFFRR